MSPVSERDQRQKSAVQLALSVASRLSVSLSQWMLALVIGRFNFLIIAWGYSLHHASLSDLVAMGVHLGWYFALLAYLLVGWHDTLEPKWAALDACGGAGSGQSSVSV